MEFVTPTNWIVYGVLVNPLPPLDSIVNVFSSDDFPGSAFSKVISSPSLKVIVPIVAVFTTTDLALSFPWTLAVKYANVAFLFLYFHSHYLDRDNNL